MYYTNIEYSSGKQVEARVWINDKAYPYRLEMWSDKGDIFHVCKGWQDVRTADVKFVDFIHGKLCVIEDCNCEYEKLIDRVFPDNLYSYFKLKIESSKNYIKVDQDAYQWHLDMCNMLGSSMSELSKILSDFENNGIAKIWHIDEKVEYVTIGESWGKSYDINLPPNLKINEGQLSLF